MSETLYFPEKLRPLFAPKRYKVCYGGRGGGRSWGIARALLIKGQTRPLRILCFRELQNSIAESVHKVLKDQIDLMGMGAFYEVQRDKILGLNGTEFSFEGIKNNPRKIKSMEGIDIAWGEEAEGVSEESWDILIPTIRKAGSEIWISFNPALETDYTYKHFVLEAGEDTVLIYMTWRDNKFFPDTLYQEMLKVREKDEDKYLNIWEGKCRVSLEGAVYAKQLRAAMRENRITTVHWDRDYAVSTFWDLGKRDHTSIWFVQRVAMQTRVLDFFEGSGEDLDYYIKAVQNKPYVYDRHYLPHDAKAKVLGSKRTIEERARAGLKSVTVLKRQSVADGISATRSLFANCWFDERRCAIGLHHLKHYSYETTSKTKDGRPIFSKEPKHDEHSDAADAFRQAGMGLKPHEIMALPDDGEPQGIAARAASLLQPTLSTALSWMRN